MAGLLLAGSAWACSGDDGTAGGDSSSGGVPENSGGAPGNSGGASSSGGDSGVGGSSNSGAGGTDPGGAGGSAAPPTSHDTTSCEAPLWDPPDFSVVYDVGPGHDYETPSDVPWESIGPSTLVRIHRRSTPYADKWVLAVVATAEEPVVVLGVPEDGLLPEIVGDGAVTRQALNFWSEQRGVIKVGGSSVPSVTTAEHVVIECLDISGARAGNTFTDDTGASQQYADNASAIFLESGNHITIRNSRIHDSGNGLFIAHETTNTLVSGNFIFDNGNVDSVYEHNSYTAGRGIIFEFNHYGPLCSGCTGNNLKDRSSGLVVRYNFIDGGNRALDIVDSGVESIQSAPDYHDSFVYGNVLIEPQGGNRQLVHYGGDGNPDHFRTGTLHFFHNTVVSERGALFSVVRLSSPSATFDARNNVFYALGGGSELAILEDAGTALLDGNWLPTDYREGTPSQSGTVTVTGGAVGSDPGFQDVQERDYTLTVSAAARGITVPLASAAAGHPVTRQYTGAGSTGQPRTSTAAAGAFE